MSNEPPIVRVVDGETFHVSIDPELPGLYHFDWVSGPNPDYGFSSRTSGGLPQTESGLDESIRAFLAQVDPRTGYIE